MNTDKEAILKAAIQKYNASVNDMHKFLLNKQELKMFFEAMDSYSNELLKENEELADKKWSAEILLEAAESAITQLQSTNEELKEKISTYQDVLIEITQLQSDNEYWKQRCEAAEELFGLDGTNLSFQKKWGKWQALK